MDADIPSRQGSSVIVKSLEKKLSHMERLTKSMKRVISFNEDIAHASIASPPNIQPHSAEFLTNEELMMLMGSIYDTDGFNLHASEKHGAPEFADASVSTRKLAIIMVGLPARGKTHIAKLLQRYLNWLGFYTEIFNVGNYRRDKVGAFQPAQFFDQENEDFVAVRLELAKACLDDMIGWLNSKSSANVAIYDATNATLARREMIKSSLGHSGIRTLFLESICHDQELVESNIRKTKLFSPDYRNMDPDEATKDFMERIENYQKVYETLTEEEGLGSFIKIVDVGKQITVNEISGYIPGKIVSFLINTHIMSRNIYLSRHGESEWNVIGRLGGDPPLTEKGQKYAQRLAEFMEEEFTIKGLPLPLVWCSQLQRARQTVQHIPTLHMCFRALNEINGGLCEGMTYEEIEEEMPEVAHARREDKLHYRYPGGESYVDVIHRLEPLILEVERQKEPVLIVAHNAVIRALYAYFMSLSRESCTNVDIPLHSILKLTTQPYGCEMTMFELNLENNLED